MFDDKPRQDTRNPRNLDVVSGQIDKYICILQFVAALSSLLMNQANELCELRVKVHASCSCIVYIMDNCLPVLKQLLVNHLGAQSLPMWVYTGLAHLMKGINVGVCAAYFLQESPKNRCSCCSSIAIRSEKNFQACKQSANEQTPAASMHSLSRINPHWILHQQEGFLHCIINLCSYHKAEACNADWVHQQQLSPNHPHKPAQIPRMSTIPAHIVSQSLLVRAR